MEVMHAKNTSILIVLALFFLAQLAVAVASEGEPLYAGATIQAKGSPHRLHRHAFLLSQHASKNIIHHRAQRIGKTGTSYRTCPAHGAATASQLLSDATCNKIDQLPGQYLAERRWLMFRKLLI